MLAWIVVLQAHRLDEALSKYFGPPQQVTQQGMYECKIFKAHNFILQKARTPLLATVSYTCSKLPICTNFAIRSTTGVISNSYFMAHNKLTNWIPNCLIQMSCALK